MTEARKQEREEHEDKVVDLSPAPEDERVLVDLNERRPKKPENLLNEINLSQPYPEDYERQSDD